MSTTSEMFGEIEEMNRLWLESLDIWPWEYDLNDPEFYKLVNDWDEEGVFDYIRKHF